MSTTTESYMTSATAEYIRLLADSPVWFTDANREPPEPSWLMAAAEHLRSYAKLIEMRGSLAKAAATLSHAVKTRDVGRCEQCGGQTQSGMDAYCHRCARLVLERFVAEFSAHGTESPESPAVES